MQMPTYAPVTPSPSRKTYNNPNHAFPLNSNMSVTTIPASRQHSSPTLAPSNTQSPPCTPTKEVVIIDPASQDNLSTLSSMSKKDLIKMLLHFNCNNCDLSDTSGFAPSREDSLHDGPQATTAFPLGGAGQMGSPFAAAMGKEATGVPLPGLREEGQGGCLAALLGAVLLILPGAGGTSSKRQVTARIAIQCRTLRSCA